MHVFKIYAAGSMYAGVIASRFGGLLDACLYAASVLLPPSPLPLRLLRSLFFRRFLLLLLFVLLPVLCLHAPSAVFCVGPP